MDALPTLEWSNYYAAMKGKPLHPHYAQLDPHLPHRGLALELGCGIGHGVVHLVSKGFRVVAVDAQAEALAHLREWLPDNADVELIESRFEDLGLEEEWYDVVCAHFSLFFLPALEFANFWSKVTGAIKPKGLISAQFLGPNDDWKERGYAMHTAQEAHVLLEAFEILYFEEVERDGETAEGTPKHWHVIHVVARKR